MEVEKAKNPCYKVGENVVRRGVTLIRITYNESKLGEHFIIEKNNINNMIVMKIH